MTEVNLVKRFYILVLIILALGGVSACTRDKPADPTPTLPLRTVVAASSASSSASSSSVTSSAVSAAPVVTATVEITSTPVIVLPPSATPPPTPTQAPMPGTTPGKYTVKWGDWLNKIAADYGVTVQAILAANPGLNPNLIYPGQVINIPAQGGSSSSSSSTPSGNPSTYTVQRGEWIYAIARKFGVSVAALLGANPGINPNFLFPGQVLNIPGGSSSSSASSSTGPGGTYTVRPGDTLFSIAVKFRTTTYALQIKNNLANPHFIYPGQVLQIP